MDERATAQNYLDRVLTTRRLRRMLKKRRTRLVPENLVEYIRHKIPEIYGPDALEIRAILNDLVATARAELDATGIQPEIEVSPQHRLNRRERNHIGDFAALLTWAAEATWAVELSLSNQAQRKSTQEEMIELSREGVRWAELSNDPLQTAISMLMLFNHLGVVPHTSTERMDISRAAIDLLDSSNSTESKRVHFFLLYGLAHIFESRGENDKARGLIEECEELITPALDKSERAFRVILLTKRVLLARQRKEYGKALEYGQQALRWSDPESYPISHCQLLQTLGLLYNTMEHLEEGLQMFLNAIIILEENSLAAEGPWVYVNAAESYHALGEISRGYEVLARVRTILGYEIDQLPENPTTIYLHIQSTEAALLYAEEKYDEALHLLEWSIQKYRDIGHRSGEISARVHSAQIYGNRDNPQKACNYLEEALSLSEGSSPLHKLRLRLTLARWKIACDEDRDACQLLDEVERELGGEQSQHINLLRLRAMICEKQRELSKALQLEREAAEMERELFEGNREHSVRYARIMAETTMIERMVEQEKEQRQRLEHELAGAVIELGEKRLLIEEATTQLRKELARKDRRTSDKGGERSTVASLYSLLSVLQKGEKVSLSPLAYLNNGRDEFIQQLRIRYPNLTTSQERLCILLRSGLSAKEICTILDIGSEGLKSRRKRLRKTFRLQQGESLEKVIAEV